MFRLIKSFRGSIPLSFLEADANPFNSIDQNFNILSLHGGSFQIRRGYRQHIRQ